VTNAPGPPTGISRRTGGWLVALFVGVALAALLSLIHLPYAVLKPGPVTNTLGNVSANKPLISVSDARTYPTSGALDFTTVAVYGGPQHPVNVWDVLGGLVDGSSHVVPEQAMFPKGTTSKQVQEENAAEMADSQQEAIAVALRATGAKVPEVVSIAQVPDGSPAKGVLRPGDQVVSVDGVPADSTEAVRRAVQKHQPGESVAVTVRRDGATRQLRARTAAADGKTVLGVLLRTRFQFPVKVSINAGDVGGPSAGMMFSLAIFDKLTPGALTGGAAIAGTGTIASDGAVGPIGGIQQKLYGARDGGARWFLAPASNCQEVVGHVPDGLSVVRVSTFAEARAAVAAIGARKGDALPGCTAVAAAP
jgi:PDZ domain-containing protein